MHLIEASAIINNNEVTKNITQDKEIGRVFAEYKNKLLVIDGKNKKDHVYLIPKTRVNRYGDSQAYFNISENILNEFEI
jgi:hypothetical protein